MHEIGEFLSQKFKEIQVFVRCKQEALRIEKGENMRKILVSLAIVSTYVWGMTFDGTDKKQHVDIFVGKKSEHVQNQGSKLPLNFMQKHHELLNAIKMTNKEIVKLLAQEYGNLSDKMRSGWNLAENINQKRLGLTKEIIESLSPNEAISIINEPTIKGMTSLFAAIEENHENIIRYLVKKGAELNSYGEYGFSLLTFTVNSKSKSVLKFFVNECKMDVNSADKFGYTPLSIAIENRDLPMLECLIEECGAKINTLDENGNTPLILSIVDDNDQLVKRLVEKFNADINLTDKEGNTPLIFAVRNQNEVITRFLIEKGADINKENKRKYTPLDFAIQTGNPHILRILIENSADIQKKHEGEYVALNCAIETKNLSTVAILAKALKKRKQKKKIAQASQSLEKLSPASNASSNSKKKKKKKPLLAQISQNQTPLIFTSSDRSTQKTDKIPIESTAQKEIENISPFFNKNRRFSISNGILPHANLDEILAPNNNRRYSISIGLLPYL